MHNPYSPVAELNLLNDFQDRVGYENFAQGFGLTEYGDTNGLAAWSEDPEFTGRLVPFAQATGGGSFYALWRLDDREDLATLPVVVFGDEGGEHVVARHVRELLQLLGFDEEITVEHERAYFYRDEDEPHRLPRRVRGLARAALRAARGGGPRRRARGGAERFRRTVRGLDPPLPLLTAGRPHDGRMVPYVSS